MKIEEKLLSPNILQLIISERLDLYNAPDYKKYLRETSTRSPGNILLDMAEVDFMDSSGLGAIVMFANEAKQKGIKVGFCNLSTFVSNLIEMSNMTLFFTVFETAEDAIATWG